MLQLEFISSKAKVSDLLTQIPLSVTEQVLQEQPYNGVMDETGVVKVGSTWLVEAFGGQAQQAKQPNSSLKLVLVAKPDGLSTKETMQLAKPILTNSQVAKMVRTIALTCAVGTQMLRTLDSCPFCAMYC